MVAIICLLMLFFATEDKSDNSLAKQFSVLIIVLILIFCIVQILIDLNSISFVEKQEFRRECFLGLLENSQITNAFSNQPQPQQNLIHSNQHHYYPKNAIQPQNQNQKSFDQSLPIQSITNSIKTDAQRQESGYIELK
ncbi:hypothetical protein ABPG74_022508 [Tetrahymena malaccensis]